jgi:hypothetical protein
MISDREEQQSKRVATRELGCVLQAHPFKHMNRLAVAILCSFVASAVATPPPVPNVIDRTKRTSSVCALHHMQMARTRVPLEASGIASPPHDYSRCPNALRPIDTGCSVLGADAHGYIWVCPQCQRACPQ